MEVNSLSQEEVDQVLATLVGDLEQLPPLYSAVKINGKNCMNMPEQMLRLIENLGLSQLKTLKEHQILK